MPRVGLGGVPLAVARVLTRDLGGRPKYVETRWTDILATPKGAPVNGPAATSLTVAGQLLR